MFFFNHIQKLKYQPSWIKVKGRRKTRGVWTSSPMINVLTIYRQQMLFMFSHICNFISSLCLEQHHLNYLTMTTWLSSNSSSQLPQATSSSIYSLDVIILNLHTILHMLPFIYSLFCVLHDYLLFLCLSVHKKCVNV
jgi:hypothetical protein